MDVVVEERMRESELFRPWGSFSEGELSTAFYLYTVYEKTFPKCGS